MHDTFLVHHTFAMCASDTCSAILQALIAICQIIMKPRIFLTSVKIGIMMIYIRISAAARPSPTVRPRIGSKVLVLYLLLIEVTAFFVAMYVVRTMHTGLHQFYPR